MPMPTAASAATPVSGRTVTLQRRAAGTTTWISVGAMAFGSVTGTYVLAQSQGGATEYRAVFSTPSNEGINGDSSPAVLVNVTRRRRPPRARRDRAIGRTIVESRGMPACA